MRTMNLELPVDLAAEADRAGLLTSEAIVELLRQRLRSLESLRRHLDRLESDPTPPMSMAEIQAEVDAARAESRLAPRS